MREPADGFHADSERPRPKPRRGSSWPAQASADDDEEWGEAYRLAVVSRSIRVPMRLGTWPTGIVATVLIAATSIAETELSVEFDT